MSKVKKLIPVLRFPEFVNDGEWVEDTLGQVVTFSKGKGISKGDIVENGKFKCIRYGELYTAYGETISEVFSSTNVDLKDLILSEENDVLIPSSGETQIDIARASCLLTPGIALGGDINILKPVINGVFLSHYLNGVKKREIARMSQGISVVHLYSSQLQNLIINFPLSKDKSKNEQQKIASCLSSLDEIISAHKDKLQALKDHKKGLIQILFPQEGKTVPNYRFSEFENDGEWNLKPLDEICKLVRGPFGGALKKEIFVKNGYAVYEQSHAIYSDFSSFRYRINDEKFSELKRFSVKSGDLIMSCSGTMGKFALIPKDFEQGAINQALLKLTAKKGFDNSFVKISLETDTNQKKLLSQSAGGAIKNVVSVSQIRELELAIPKPEEQQKIASCLADLDKLITAQEEKIEQLQLHKKGLMQGLFPKIEN